MTQYTIIKSSWGHLLLTAETDALTGIYFQDCAHAPAVPPTWQVARDLPLFAETERQLAEFAAGQRREFDLPLAPKGTPFQQETWRQIAAVPYGEVISYSELASRVGAPAAIRAAGTATGRNPLSIVVPCHRIVGRTGAITGYAGGLDRKRALLRLEGHLY